jgi:uncharacterized protein (TIGR00369 family)
MNFKDKEQKITLFREAFQNMMPANKLFGLIIEELEEGYTKIRVPFKEDFIGDFIQRRWHGGILASIADTAGGLVGAVTLASPVEKINTINMRIDYLHGAKAVDIYAEAFLVKNGKRVVNVDVKIFQEGNEEAVAIARCAYSVLRID